MPVSTHLTRYESQAIVTRLGHMYLFDSGEGEIIAQVSDELACEIRAHPADAVHLDYDGAGHITRTPA